MKKSIFILFILILFICITACIQGEVTDGKIAETTSSNADATAVVTDDISEGSLLYMDPKIDILLNVDSADWVYTKELYEGEVYFYLKNENPTASYNGFAISSQQAGGSTVEQQWEIIKNNFETSIPGFEWSKEEDIEVGNYSGYRYHFSGNEFVGDYIFWETEARLYTCSFTSFADDYEDNVELLINSLKSFKTLGEMQSS